MDTFYFSKPKDLPAPSLASTLGLTGHVTWRDLGACKLTYEDNPEEIILVAVCKKRQLHVVTDQMLRARASMDEPVAGNFNFRGVYA